MGVFHTLSAGKMGQPAMDGVPWAMADPDRKIPAKAIIAHREKTKVLIVTSAEWLLKDFAAN
jgi:hypothetical protein